MRRLLLLLLLVAAAACGTSTEPSTATTPGVATVPPMTGGSGLLFPVTVEWDGLELTIDDQPQRIVSLSATHTEMLYAIGAGHLIAATDFTSNYPPAANNTPKVDAFNFNAEEVLALDPDLVILAFNFNNEVDALGAAGVDALLLPPPTGLADVFRQFEVVGVATGLRDEGFDEAGRLRDRIEAIVASYEPPAEPLTFFHEVDETLFSTNSSTFLGQLYGLFGLVNIADEAPDEFGSGFPQLSAEFILERDPDLIFLGDAAFGVTIESLSERPGWDELSAVANGTVFDLDAEISGRWGPRTDQVVRQILEAVSR